jgi:Fic family protein
MCIHPYNHGNGRLSRLLLYFLLKKYGYNIDSYFSLSYLVRQKIGGYIDAFASSCDRWSENENDYSQYVIFLLKIVLEGYHKLDYIIETNSINGTAEEKVLRIVVDSSTPISKSVIQNVLYGASGATIEKALAKLVRDNRIQLITKGRYSKYFRV